MRVMPGIPSTPATAATNGWISGGGVETVGMESAALEDTLSGRSSSVIEIAVAEQDRDTLDKETRELLWGRESALLPSLSFHEAAAYVCLSGTHPVSRQACYQVMSLCLVAAQLIVCMSVSVGASSPSCAMSRHCPGSRVCTGDHNAYNAMDQQLGPNFRTCVNCGDGMAKVAILDYIARGIGDNFTCPFHDEVCRGCFDPEKRTFSTYTFREEVADNLSAMRFNDYVAVVFAVVMIGCQLATDVDLSLKCDSIRRVCKQDAEERRGGFSRLEWLWYRCLQLEFVLRRYAVHPQLCVSAYCLVSYRGGDALSVCLNTVALKFLIQTDEILLAAAVHVNTRTLFADAISRLFDNRKAFDAALTDLLAITKLAHSIYAPCIVLLSLIVSHRIFVASRYFSDKDLMQGVDGGHVITVLYLLTAIGESQVRAYYFKLSYFRTLLASMVQVSIAGLFMFGFFFFVLT